MTRACSSALPRFTFALAPVVTSAAVASRGPRLGDTSRHQHAGRPPMSTLDEQVRQRAARHGVPGQFLNPRTGVWESIDAPPPFSSSTFAGVMCLLLLGVCTCAFLSRTPRCQGAFTTKRGPMGVLWKAAVLGTRLHAWVAAACFGMGCYVLFVAV